MTIRGLTLAPYPFFAVLAGLELDVFTPVPVAPANLATVMAPGAPVYVSGSGPLDDDRTGPAFAAAFNIAFVNAYGAATAYTERDYRELLDAAGCGDFERARQPDGSSFLRAVRRG